MMVYQIPGKLAWNNGVPKR